MFIDEVKIKVVSGKGGDGLVSWRREKYIPKGGPWGGNGGKGGDVYLQTTSNLNTLSEYRHKKLLKAESGEKGGTNNKHGADGEDLIIFIPVGTIVKNSERGEKIVDLDENNTKYLIAKGGRGGYGNSHFVSSTRQAPYFAELGDISDEKEISLELKLVADIGIIGIPSAGKSSLIGNITNVSPKIGDYPFTTIIPNLGVLDHKGKSLILEDVPGLIPGASSGKGLGTQFLKHIERTGVLLHMLNLYRLDKVFDDYEDLRNELKIYSENNENSNIDKKEEIIVFSKADLLDNEMKKYILSEFKKKFKIKNIFIISSANGEGIDELKDFLIDTYSKKFNLNNEEKDGNEIKIFDLKQEDTSREIKVTDLENQVFQVKGERIEQIVRMTDFENPEALMRIYDVLEKIGVINIVEKRIKKLEVDNDFFFEGNKNEALIPSILIGERKISLDKLKFKI